MEKVHTRKPNQLKAWLSLTWYSLLAAMRSPANLFFGFLFPFIFIVVFGLLDTGGVAYDIYVRDDSITEGVLYDVLKEIEPINLITDEKEEEITEKLNKGQAPAAITITAEDVSLGETKSLTSYHVKLETSAADPQNAAVVQSILDGVINQINNPPGQDQFQLVELEQEVIEGRKYTQIDFILPGQLAFALLSTGVFSIVFTFISLRDTLVIKRIFATPTPRWSILTSEAAAKLVNGLLQAVVIVVLGVLLFDFTLANGVITLLSILVLSAIGLLVFLGFGLFVSSIAKSEESAPAIANLVTLPQFLLSGAFFPTEAFPDFLQPISQILPMTFLVDAMRAVSFEGANLIDVAPDILGLLVWGVIIYAIVVRIFKWE